MKIKTAEESAKELIYKFGIYLHEDQLNGFYYDIGTIQAESRLAALEEAAFLCKLDVESLERDAIDIKEKKDELNAYLYDVQAMAHRLDVERIKKVIKHLSKEAK